MSRRLAILACCVVVGLLTAWYAGSRFEPTTPGPASGSVALGPHSGELVADYLARLPAELPPPGAAAYALVQFDTALTGPEALAAVDGTQPARAVFRVPFERVQTALRFEGLGAGGLGAGGLGPVDVARQRARHAAAADAARLTGRAGAVAAAEATALADPGCACLVALVVRGDRAALEAVAAGPEVRAVHAAPADAQPVELA
ncbi:MAG: hypothetical protein L0H64_13710, partial [Pseudonocardia sp.]|nr:hypothetical protein [Pseudonocardia sp.]